MRKIITGVIGIILTLTVAGGVAYAAFTAQAEVLGTSFNAGTPGLLVSLGSGYLPTQTATSPWLFQHLYPGFGSDASKFTHLYLKNSSDSVALTITGKLRDVVTETPAGSWNILKDKVWVGITLDSDTSQSTGWQKLSDWNSTGFTLPGGSLAIGAEQHYRFYVQVDPSAGNEIKGAGISDVNFDFVGTQTP